MVLKVYQYHALERMTGMNKIYLFLILISWTGIISGQNLNSYDVTWNSQSKNSSESMPCGGGDIGLNVWVEDGQVCFYMSRSGTFDENNTLLKLGKIRINTTPNIFSGKDFTQKLNLKDGYITITSKGDDYQSSIKIWVDVFNPVVNVDVASSKKIDVQVFYDSWRYQDRLLRKMESNQNSYKWAAPKDLTTLKDSIYVADNNIYFYHQNKDSSVFDVAVEQQGLSSYKSELYNPLEDLVFGGVVMGSGFTYVGTSQGVSNGTDYRSWELKTSKARKNTSFQVKFQTSVTPNIGTWENELSKVVSGSFKQTKSWWNDFWNRSWVIIDQENINSKDFEIGRNYQLFRYMLGCNAYGSYPTKFNGGLFTYDPQFTEESYQFTPDFRKWGGGTHTAQNQRLVYFPMIKSGDFDMMTPQFDFYNRIKSNAELRSRVYWGHEGASFTEQIENFGLPNPSEYGWKRPPSYDKGMEYNAWLEYQWDTALEFCLMILEKEQYTGQSIQEYIPLIKSVLQFFEEHYIYIAKTRGAKAYNGEGKLVFYPGSSCETYKMAYNAVSTISGLEVVSKRLKASPSLAGDSVSIEHLDLFISQLPEMKTRSFSGKETIAPAWLWERINNVETPQLYPVFPWTIFGLTKPNLDLAINTWKYDPDVSKFRSHVGWKQDAIWAAKLGLVSEANELVWKKLESSETRFPTFWGPGFDWTPDHNWGGSGMIALQEMLLQVDDKKIILFPAWDKTIDVHFKLCAPYNTTVECELKNGEIKSLKVLPQEREKDVINWLNLENKPQH